VAGVYSPTITTFPAPVVTIVSQDATLYETIQQSLTTTTYVATAVELTATSNDQLLQPVNFSNYDVNGDLANFVVTPASDPYQYQTALELDLGERNIIFDGRTKMNVQVLGNSTINLDFDVAQVSAAGADDLGGALDDAALAEVHNNTIFKGIEDFQEGVEEMYDYDFMNRTGFFEDINTSMSECYPNTLEDLFTDFKDAI
jgi:hypothetical protein